jgi:hypothetical protein
MKHKPSTESKFSIGLTFVMSLTLQRMAPRIDANNGESSMAVGCRTRIEV